MKNEEGAVRVCGRLFSSADIAAIRSFIERRPAASRREIATWTCEALEWLRPNGQVKEMSCRVALLRLEDRGLVRLPPPRKRSGNRKPYRPAPTIEVPQAELLTPPGRLRELRVRRVEDLTDSQRGSETSLTGIRRRGAGNSRRPSGAEEGEAALLHAG